jgi:hypothetical protein
MSTIHKKYEAQYETLRSVSMPDEGSIKQDMAGELADLREMYKAKNRDLHSAGGETYAKKLPALKASYHADQFRIQQSYDKQLRQMNRAYDQQKGMLQRQHESELADAEKRSLYDVGHMHAIDLMEQQGILNSDDAKRARFAAVGLKLPTAKKPADQRIDFDRTTQVVNNLEQIDKQYSIKKSGNGNHLMKWSIDPDTGRKTSIDVSQDEDETQRFWANRRSLMRMKGVQMKSAASLGVVAPQAGNAGAYLGNGLAARAASQLSGDMGESMKSPPKTRPIEPTAPKKLDLEGRKSLIRQAGGDVNRAKQMAKAMGYE